jgi:hypothetical protein
MRSPAETMVIMPTTDSTIRIGNSYFSRFARVR